MLFDDVTEEFSQISLILEKCEEWRKNDFNSYKETYFSLCLPKVLSSNYFFLVSRFVFVNRVMCGFR